MRPRALILICGALLASAQPAFACAACFGASDSELARGMNMGIFALLFVIVSVLVSISGFFIYLARRSARFTDTALETAAGDLENFSTNA